MDALSISGLVKTYANGLTALRGIDLNVRPGDFFALLGPNGAGKSTTIGIVTSLVNKTTGSVQVFGHDLELEPSAAKGCLGVVPQELNFNNFEAVEDIVVNQAGYYGIPRREGLRRAQELLAQLGLSDKRRQASRLLSGGMKRRLMIARALVHRPRLLILDEPTAGVDIEIRRSMWQYLREINARGTTIILTTHYLEEAESLCRNIAIIDGGEIIENTSMRELLTRLHVETFVLDLSAPLVSPPKLDRYEVRMIDSTCVEVDVEKSQRLNDLFALLSGADIQVISMRNKANRLEETFMKLLENKDASATSLAA
jgi:ABC-2 type transport system ATP-binding protein